MEMIAFDRIVSVNSEIQGHAAQNILNPEVSSQKSWLCEKGTDKAIVILQLRRATFISSVHIGNAHSAFIEVLVGRATDSSDEFQSLVPMSTYMNPLESKTSRNPNVVRFFHKQDFSSNVSSKQWDRIKVVCSQPFNKQVPFGVCFVKVLGEKQEGDGGSGSREGKKEGVSIRSEEEQIEIGSFFKKKKETVGEKQLSVHEQIREAEKPSYLAKHSPLTTSKITEKMKEKHSSSSDKRKKEKRKHEEGDDNRKNRDLGLDEGQAKKFRSEEESPKKQKREETPKKTKDDKKEKKTTKTDKQDETERKQKRDRDKSKDKKGSTDKKETKVKKTKPFNKLMDDVVFVISGFKNPLRGDIRSQAMEMGAKYSVDWDDKCTHLISAYDNTPKVQQVKGKGKIVKRDWIEKCHKERKRYPWRKYALDKDEAKENESENEIFAEDVIGSAMGGDAGSSSQDTPTRKESNTSVKDKRDESSHRKAKEKTPRKGKEKSTEKTSEKQSSEVEIYDVSTDDDDEDEKKVAVKEEKRTDTSELPMPYLPDFFTLKTFYVDPNLDVRQEMERYIIAYNGILTEALNSDVEYYITNTGGVLLDIFRKKAPNFIAVKPDWIWEVNAKDKWVSTSEFLVT